MTERNVSNSKEGLESTNVSLLARVRCNEGTAWEMLVELYAPMIYSRCRHHWGLDPADAENVGQEVFRAVARSITGFRRQREGSFRKWLRVIIDNKCRDHFRKQSVDVAEGGTQAFDLIKSIADEINDDSVSDGDAEIGEKSILMRQAMRMVQDEFSTRDWKIFWDVIIEDKHRSDTAQNFDVSENVVYLAISRIQKRLRQVFEDLLDDDIYPNEKFD
ncbi:RNA polymerase sigma factor [Mariniblastus fucicola]|uniref:RNA polymerase factor sigma-70 n=1 Tax=Mariniblastus fucicola TaxID=980251 RepID=A0A5B9PDJ2_9BACT|nr:sigma-70 family RNA polymerase sigma factor [Mariniblastus fucicola]QEG24448.1 RNA polymerase factor sigma-70 [Mariniblastus fucicola]